MESLGRWFGDTKRDLARLGIYARPDSRPIFFTPQPDKIEGSVNEVESLMRFRCWLGKVTG